MPAMGWPALLWRPVAVTSVMALAMLAGAQVNLALGFLLGILVYPAGLWLIGTFGPEEKQILSSLLPGQLSARLGLETGG